MQNIVVPHWWSPDVAPCRHLLTRAMRGLRWHLGDGKKLESSHVEHINPQISTIMCIYVQYIAIYISPLEFSFTEMIPLILYHPLSNHIPSYRVPWFLNIRREPQEYWPIRCCKSWNQKGYERHQHFMKSSSSLSSLSLTSHNLSIVPVEKGVIHQLPHLRIPPERGPSTCRVTGMWLQRMGCYQARRHEKNSWDGDIQPWCVKRELRLHDQHERGTAR